MARCGTCEQEMTDLVPCVAPTWRIEGVERSRIPYPPTDTEYEPASFPASCRDCGTPHGGLHHPGCGAERCPNCTGLDGRRGQAISCGCHWEGDDELKTDSGTWHKVG